MLRGDFLLFPRVFSIFQSILSVQTAKEKESKKMTDEILQLLSAPTAKEQSLMERFKSQGGDMANFVTGPG